MEIYHWWLVKMVAIQLLCLLGIAWGVRYLWQRRLVAAQNQKAASSLAVIETQTQPDPTQK